MKKITFKRLPYCCLFVVLYCCLFTACSKTDESIESSDPNEMEVYAIPVEKGMTPEQAIEWGLSLSAEEMRLSSIEIDVDKISRSKCYEEDEKLYDCGCNPKLREFVVRREVCYAASAFDIIIVWSSIISSQCTKEACI